MAHVGGLYGIIFKISIKVPFSWFISKNIAYWWLVGNESIEALHNIFFLLTNLQ